MTRGVVGWTDTAMYDWESDPGTPEVNLPDVKGWKLIVIPLEAKSKTDGGIHIPETMKADHEQIITVGVVHQLGELCYTRPDMLVEESYVGRSGASYPTKVRKPWCKEGDLVIFGKYAGMRIVFKGVAVRILNDDEIIAVVPR